MLASACGATDRPIEETASNLQALVSIERTRLAPAAEQDAVDSNAIGGLSQAGEDIAESEAIGDSESVGEPDTSTKNEGTSGTALAQFLVLPAEVDPRRTLDWAGLSATLPGPTRCWRPNGGSGELSLSRLEAAALGSVDSLNSHGTEPNELLELLAAGEVVVRAGAQQTQLALNFFPPSGSASGVLYSSRDRAAEPLPAEREYLIEVSGSEQVPSLTIRAQAPAELNDVQLEGEQLVEGAVFASGEPIQWSWSHGAAGDRVYIHLHLSGDSSDLGNLAQEEGTNSESVRSVVCAFEDSDGTGTIPAEFTADFTPNATVRVGLHRIREVLRAEELPKAATDPETSGFRATLVETTMRFDFEYATTLRSE